MRCPVDEPVPGSGKPVEIAQPVEQRMFLPQATLGSAKAYLGLQDFDRARTAIKDIKENFAATPEAKATDALSEKLEKRAALLTTSETRK